MLRLQGIEQPNNEEAVPLVISHGLLQQSIQRGGGFKVGPSTRVLPSEDNIRGRGKDKFCDYAWEF